MKTKIEIERLADETLNSLDRIQQVDANEFLYTRIEARSRKHREQFIGVKYLSGLSAALVLFISLNMASYYFLSDKGPERTQVAKQQKSTAAEALAAEYNLSSDQYSY